MDRKIPYYAGNDFADPDYADGQLPHVLGASSYQVMRSNRSHPEWSDGLGNTYNHAPMLTYWRGKFYLEYLSNPVHEHTGGGCSLLVVSEDGIHWGKPRVSFPVIKAPAGVYRCADGQKVVVPEDRDAMMHQRMAFFHSCDDRLLVTGFYGHVPDSYTCPWVNYGMGRAVREIYEDGSMGPIYFLRVLTASGWTEEKLPFPHFSRSGDQGFVKACEECLNDRLVTQQWAEEHGDRDEYVHIKQGNAAGTKDKQSSFCWYHLDEQNIVGLWKNGVAGRSEDGGDTWQIQREPSFATSGAKSWGQKTEDGRFAIAYVNSIASEHRYPMCAVTSDDGICFDDLGVICGEVPPRRYEGLFKDFGPQYLRGICEGHREYPTGAMWLCHSMNKEDIWVTRVPVPLRLGCEEHADDTFADAGSWMKNWNIYSSRWAAVEKAEAVDAIPCMRISDRDPVDYARAERMFKPEKQLRVECSILPCKWYEEKCYLELTDHQGRTAVRLAIGEGNVLWAQTTSVMIPAKTLSKHLDWLNIAIEADCETCRYRIEVNGQETDCGQLTFRQKVNQISRFVLRTKPYRKAPGVDKRPDTPDMPDVDEPCQTERVYMIRNVKTTPGSRIAL